VTERQRIGDQTRFLKLRCARVPVWREFIVRADEKLSAFIELESTIRRLNANYGNRKALGHRLMH